MLTKKRKNIHLLFQSEDNVIGIKILPDEQGRYGFNVTGGSDMGMPILVSRVAPNTPADRCYPKLNEGDQVIKKKKNYFLYTYFLVVTSE